MISVHIKKKWEGFTLEVNFETSDRHIGILGASGCGKSMTLQCIAGIITPDSGNIIIDGTVFFDSSKKINMSTKKRKTGYLFQNYALFPHMTVLENIMSGMGKGNKKEKQSQAEELMKRFAITELAKRLPYELSGGQQQRIAIARMMAYEPELILLDEPYSALDGFLREKMQQELMELLDDFQGSVIMVSHNRDEIYRFSETVLTMSAGCQLRTATTSELFLDPQRVEVARLTGCNNITAIKRVSEYEVYAPEWNVNLMTNVPVTDNIRYIGIRSHDLRVGKPREVNSFYMELRKEDLAPFEYKYGLTPYENKAKENIWWKEYKTLEDKEEKRQFPCWITLPPHKLLLLTE